MRLGRASVILNVLDYIGNEESDPVGAAIKAARDGDIIYIPSDNEFVAPAGGWQITKSLTLRGDAVGLSLGDPEVSSGASRLRPANNREPVLVIVPPASRVHIHDLELMPPIEIGAVTPPGPNAFGIVCKMDADHPTPSIDIRLERLVVWGMPSDGIHVEGHQTAPEVGTCVDGVTIIDTLVHGCGGAGIWLRWVNAVNVTGLRCASNGGNGIYVEYTKLLVTSSTFDGNCTGTESHGNVRCYNCFSGSVESSRFLNLDAGMNKYGVVLDGGMGIVGTCFFEAAGTDGEGPSAGTVGIELTESSLGSVAPGPMVVLGNRFRNIETLVKLSVAYVQNCTILPQYDEGSGEIALLSESSPLVTTVGLAGAPHIIRKSGSVITGMLIPAVTSDLNGFTRDGVVAMNVNVGLTPEKRLRLYSDGAWRSVSAG